MKKTYTSPTLRWAVMEANYLQSVSTTDAPAKQPCGMDSRSEDSQSNEGGSIWSEW